MGSLECFEVTLPLSISSRHLILPVRVECRLKFRRLSLARSLVRSLGKDGNGSLVPCDSNLELE